MWETSFEKYCIVRLWWLSFTNTLSWINVWLKQPTTWLKWLKYIKTECDCLLVGCGAEECLLHGFESKNSPYNLVLKIINITLLYQLVENWAQICCISPLEQDAKSDCILFHWRRWWWLWTKQRFSSGRFPGFFLAWAFYLQLILLLCTIVLPSSR